MIKEIDPKRKNESKMEKTGFSADPIDNKKRQQRELYEAKIQWRTDVELNQMQLSQQKTVVHIDRNGEQELLNAQQH